MTQESVVRFLDPADAGSAGRILLVDDEPANRDVLRRRLERHQYIVVTAPGGEEALAAVAAHEFDLVLLDVMMPKMSGLEVLRRLRATQGPSALPVIMATARGLSEDVVDALSLGANDYLTKPIDVPVALARIKAQVAAVRASRRLRASEERYALAARCDNAGLWDWNVESDVFFVDDRWSQVTGTDGSVRSWNAWVERIHPSDRAAVSRSVAAHLDGRTTHWERDFRVQHADGDVRWVVCRGLVERDPEGRARRFAGSLQDVTAARTWSALTGLPNRVRFLDLADSALARRKRYTDYSFAAAFLVVERWDLVNQTMGSAAAETMLREVASRLTSSIRNNDVVAHLGDNEFALLFDGVASIADAQALARRVTSALGEPFDVDGRPVRLVSRIGLVAATCDYVEPDELLRDAGIAAGSGAAESDGLQVFNRGMRDALVTRAETEAGLKAAIDAGALQLVYQPIVDLRTGQVKELEALVRWPHPTRGVLGPAAFLDVAEQTGLIAPLGRWCLLTACRAAAEWRLAHTACADLVVNVNVSPGQLSGLDIVSDVRRALEASGLPPSALKIEVTETAVMRDVDAARLNLVELAALGVRIALDDFGVGHSTLSYLSDLPVHALKIDRSFVSRMQQTRDDREIVGAVVALARRLNVTVTAEGIETPGQLRDLKALDCEMGQGYLLAMPMAPQDVRAFVEGLAGPAEHALSA